MRHWFLVRHGIAVEPRLGIADAERRLTEQGRTLWARSVAGLRALGVRPDVVLHSPWLRAFETAQLLADGVGCPSQPTALLAAPPDDALLSGLSALDPALTQVALIGHQPWMGELAAWLVTGAQTAGGRFPFKKGAVAWLEGRAIPGGCELRAFWTPRTLRSIDVSVASK